MFPNGESCPPSKLKPNPVESFTRDTTNVFSVVDVFDVSRNIHFILFWKLIETKKLPFSGFDVKSTQDFVFRMEAAGFKSHLFLFLQTSNVTCGKGS